MIRDEVLVDALVRPVHYVVASLPALHALQNVIRLPRVREWLRDVRGVNGVPTRAL
jgi:hypothetical protein